MVLTTLASLIIPSVLAGPDHLMLGIDGPRPPPGLAERLEDLGGALGRCFPRSRLCLATLPQARHTALQGWPGLRYVEPDRSIAPSWPGPPPPGDADGTVDCPDPWELDTIRAWEAWDQVDGTWAPVVAIQDGGFLTTHQELAGRIAGQYDHGDGDPVAEVSQQVGVPAHGTFIAGLIAGDPDNGRGRSGVAPYGQLNLQKIADRRGDLYFSYAVAAMADLAEGDLGVRVLSYSIAGPSTSQAFADAVAALEHAGILLVTAAGNCGVADCSDADNDSHPMYPGSYSGEHIVVVASSTREDGFNPYSHYGARSVDLAAPGEDLCSCGVLGDDDYYTSGGTSYATPLVAATAALLLEAHPDLDTTELARVLRASATDLPAWEGRVRSGGRLDAAAALQTAVPRFDGPPDVAIDGTGTWALEVDNPGASGEVWIVLGHGAGLDLADAHDTSTDQPWTVETLEISETLTLPDAGAVTVGDTRLTVLRGALAAHTTASLVLTVRGRQVGTWDVSARAVMVSDGADYLNSPYSQGTEDPTGFLAWQAQVRVTETTDDSGTLDSGLADTGPATDASETGPGGCGCAAGPGPGSAGWWGWVVAGLAGLRRRTTLRRVGCGPLRTQGTPTRPLVSPGRLDQPPGRPTESIGGPNPPRLRPPGRVHRR